ncbi:MAG: YitT family protein [Butyrivibrio sp.]|nr:YitT family protein [Butyrivibrio sp.]
MKKYLRYPAIVLGAVVMGFAVKCIYNPGNIVTGGFAGFAIIARRVWGVPLWTVNLALNIPLFIATFIILGKKVVARSFLATAVYTLTMALAPAYGPFAGDMFLSCLTGGLLMGAGIGLVLAADASSGGVDMLSLLIYNYTHKIKIQWIMFIADAVIIGIGIAVFGLVSAVYAVLSVLILSFISGKIIDGGDFSRAAVIISGQKEEISSRIIKEIGRGVTGIEGRGMYTGRHGLLLFCVASRHEMTKIRGIVYEVDKNAFMTVANVSEVFGEGFVKK